MAEVNPIEQRVMNTLQNEGENLPQYFQNFRDRCTIRVAQCILFAEKNGVEKFEELISQKGLGNRDVSNTLARFGVENRGDMENIVNHLNEDGVISRYIQNLNRGNQ